MHTAALRVAVAMVNDDRQKLKFGMENYDLQNKFRGSEISRLSEEDMPLRQSENLMCHKGNTSLMLQFARGGAETARHRSI
jgi:hypothetical protein